MEKLQTTSRRLQRLVLIIMILTPCFEALIVITGEWGDFLDIPQGIPFDASGIHGVSLFVLIILGSIKPAATLLAFGFLYKLLGLYRKGIIFMTNNVTTIRKIGWALIAIDIADMFQTLITGPILTFYKISSGYIAARIEVGFLVVGLFIVLVSYVMDLGRELKEQDDLVI